MLIVSLDRWPGGVVRIAWRHPEEGVHVLVVEPGRGMSFCGRADAARVPYVVRDIAETVRLGGGIGAIGAIGPILCDGGHRSGRRCGGRSGRGMVGGGVPGGAARGRTRGVPEGGGELGRSAVATAICPAYGLAVAAVGRAVRGSDGRESRSRRIRVTGSPPHRASPAGRQPSGA